MHIETQHLHDDEVEKMKLQMNMKILMKINPVDHKKKENLQNDWGNGCTRASMIMIL